MKKILFITYGGGHSAIIEPLLNEFKFHEIKVVCIALTGSFETLSKYNEHDFYSIKKISDYTHLFLKDIFYINKWGKFIINTMNKINIKDVEESNFYLGISMLELVKKYGKDKAIKLYNEYGRLAFLPINVANKILKFENPDIVFTTNSPRMEKSFVLASNNLKIKNFQINDLFAQEAINIVSQNIIVMNDYVRKELEIRKGCNLYVLGQPALEVSQKTIKKLNKNMIIKKLNIKPDLVVVTFFTQKLLVRDDLGNVSGFDSNDRLVEAYHYVFMNLLKDSRFQICIRTHPNEDYSVYENLFQYAIHLNPKLTSYESISISDIVVIQDSTVGVEALLSNKLVFTFDDENRISPTFKQAPFHYFTDSKDVLNAILTFDKFKTPARFKIPKNSAKKIKELLINNL